MDLDQLLHVFGPPPVFVDLDRHLPARAHRHKNPSVHPTHTHEGHEGREDEGGKERGEPQQRQSVGQQRLVGVPLGGVLEQLLHRRNAWHAKNERCRCKQEHVRHARTARTHAHTRARARAHGSDQATHLNEEHVAGYALHGHDLVVLERQLDALGIVPAFLSTHTRDTHNTAHDTRHTTHDTRHTTHDTRHTTHDTRHTARHTRLRVRAVSALGAAEENGPRPSAQSWAAAAGAERCRRPGCNC